MVETHELMKEGGELARKKDWAQALERFQAAATLSPEDPETHFMEGCCHFKMNHGPGARAAWERALKADPNHAGTRDAIALVTGVRLA